MRDELVTEIMALPREIVIEAARFLAADLTGEVSDEQGESAGAWAAQKPFTHVGDVETLARLVLIAGALGDAETSARVDTAIAGAGRQNLVLGGGEIVALAGLGVIALQILLTRGKLTDREITTGQDSNGRPTVIIRVTEKPISLSESLATVLKTMFGHH